MPWNYVFSKTERCKYLEILKSWHTHKKNLLIEIFIFSLVYLHFYWNTVKLKFPQYSFHTLEILFFIYSRRKYNRSSYSFLLVPKYVKGGNRSFLLCTRIIFFQRMWEKNKTQYTVAFKLQILEYAKVNVNTSTAGKFDLDESWMWRKEKEN